MEKLTFCVPCLFGLEGLVGDELKRLGLQLVEMTANGQLMHFRGEFDKIRNR